MDSISLRCQPVGRGIQTNLTVLAILGWLALGTLPALAFDPADISGLKLRYDIHSLATADGSVITNLLDTSGNSYHAPAYAAGTGWTNNLIELNNQGYLQFKQVSHFVATNPAIAQPNTIFMVARVYPVAGTYYLMSSGNNLYQTASGYIGMDAGTAKESCPINPIWMVYEFQFNGSSSLLRTNGNACWSSATVGTASQAASLKLGSRSDNANEGLFDLAYVLFYNAALTTEQSSNVNYWLNEKHHVYGYSLPGPAGPPWYASPTGKSSSDADGSIGNPWDIYTAFRATNQIAPGDTLYLRGGTHLGGALTNLNSSLALYLVGASNNPIVIRPYQNEKPVLSVAAGGQNNEILAIYGDYTTVRDLEISNPSVDRYTWADYAPGVSFYEGTGNKLVNCYIHDTGEGFWVGLGSKQTEIYGCYIYNNGSQNLTTTNTDGSARAPDTRGHGHGIYARSAAPTTLFAENVIFNQFGLGIQCYTTSSSQPLIGFRIEGNISFGNGRNSQSGDWETQILLGGGGLADQALVFTNFALGPDSGSTTTTFGSGAGVGDNNTGNGSIILSGNHWLGDYNFIKCWTNCVFTNNSVQGKIAILNTTFAIPAKGLTAPDAAHVYDWNRNTYNIGWDKPFYVSTNAYHLSFAQWQATNGFDANSTFSTSLPTGTEIYIRTNKYDPNRAHIVVLNWVSNSTVNVDLSGYVQTNQAYEIRSAQNPLAAAVVAGTYAGTPVTLPMRNLPVALPTGKTTAPAETGPFFNVFVLQRRTNTLPPPGNLHVTQ